MDVAMNRWKGNRVAMLASHRSACPQTRAGASGTGPP
jgi:hypothetical protein